MPRDDLPYCDCEWFERAARDPKCPVEFDAELNEFNIKTADGGLMRMYHCPFCTGRAPDSLRAEQFAQVPAEEVARLHRLTRDLRTEDDVIAALGEPTHRFDPGQIVQSRPEPGEASVIRTASTLSYEQHSETAVIDIAVASNGRISVSFHGKSIGRRTRS
jgi:hypothetical protein